MPLYFSCIRSVNLFRGKSICSRPYSHPRDQFLLNRLFFFSPIGFGIVGVTSTERYADDDDSSDAIVLTRCSCARSLLPANPVSRMTKKTFCNNVRLLSIYIFGSPEAAIVCLSKKKTTKRRLFYNVRLLPSARRSAAARTLKSYIGSNGRESAH